MKKKLIFLNTLLLGLLFALSSKSFANTSLTINEFKNILYNTMTNYGDHDSEDITNAINEFDFDNISVALNYNFVYVMGDIQTQNLPTTNSNIIYLTIYFTNSNRFSMYNYISCKGYYQIQYNGSTKNMSYGRLSGVLGSETYIQQNGYSSNSVRYNDLSFYNNTNGGSVTLEAGYHPSNIAGGQYTEVQYEFIPNSTTRVTVDGLSQNFYAITRDATISKYLGTLIKSRYTEGIYSDFYIYNTYSNSWQYLNERVVYNKANGYIDEFFNTDKTHDYWTSTIFIKNNILTPNIYFRYQFIPENADFNDYIDIWFYVTDEHTKYNNGVISPAITFSGDYINQYKEITGQLSEAIEEQITQDNIKDINDTLTDDSQVDNIINETLSGDNLIDSLGYSPLENPFTTIILNTMEAFTEALLDSGNETLTFTVFNNTITIHSEDFTLPNGNLKNFISLICNAFVVYELIKYGFKLYQWINSGRLQNLVNETNNHQYYLF